MQTPSAGVRLRAAYLRSEGSRLEFRTEVDGKSRFDGWIELQHDRCWMAFPVTFTRPER